MMNLMKRLYKFQSAKLSVFQFIFGDSEGIKEYNKFLYKAKKNVVRYFLLSNTENVNLLIEYFSFDD